MLLVVAADDGVMPQTREHLEIVDLLGIAQGAVALTKIDHVPAARVAEVQAEIEQLLAGSTLAGSPVFPVSSIQGDGIDVLRAHLEAAIAPSLARGPRLDPIGESAAAMLRSPADDGDFRLAVDRCFTLTGSGTVVTGTVFAGRVQVGDKLVVSPSGKEVRVRSIHAQNRASESVQAADFRDRVGDTHLMRDPALLVDKPKSIHAGTAQSAKITGRESYPGGAT